MKYFIGALPYIKSSFRFKFWPKSASDTGCRHSFKMLYTFGITECKLGFDAFSAI